MLAHMSVIVVKRAGMNDHPGSAHQGCTLTVICSFRDGFFQL